MILLTLRDIVIQYGLHLHIDKLNLTIEQGERIALLGRNGAGKSTLLKLIAKEIQPDQGIVECRKELKVAALLQEVPQELTGNVYSIIAAGLGEQFQLLTDYHQLSQQINHTSPQEKLNALSDLQHRMDVEGAWTLQQKIDSIISLMNLNGDLEFSTLSGGMKRRGLLARALVNDPDLILLDEPTNHLDIEAINWLEDFFSRYAGTVLLVTHDREFLQKISTRIIDLDRGQLTSWPCDYHTYLQRKADALLAEEKNWALFDKKLAQEEVWIRQGIKARRTRNEGRVTALKKMREVRRQRRERIGKVNLQIHTGEQSGQLVIVADNVTCTLANKNIINNFSTTIMRGDKIGIIGPNGVGKTTLLKLLLGELLPSSGTIKQGTQLNIAYYDQLRTQLDEQKSVLDNIAEGSSAVTINGKSKHIMSYLQDFLFTPERARTPVTSLSGGERNRLVLAKIFSQPSNVLVMDEPTNDLDMETLDLLEELLLEYTGTLLLVSHDRAFLNNVVTSTLVFEGDGQVNEYVGGYNDWLRQRRVIDPSKPPVQQESTTQITQKSRKLNNKEQRELNELPTKIEKLEMTINQLQQSMATPEFYQQPKEQVLQLQMQLKDLEQELQHAYRRWQELEQK